MDSPISNDDSKLKLCGQKMLFHFSSKGLKFGMELVWEYALHADIWHFGIHENDLRMPILAKTLPNVCRKPY